MKDFPKAMAFGKSSYLCDMNAEKYDYSSDEDSLIYVFFSEGKKGVITKVVVYERIAPNHFNLAFDDYDAITNNVNDKSVSNNGDTVKILATVIQTMHDFFTKRPYALLDIQGSTPTRTRIYQKIIRDNFSVIENDYKVWALKTLEAEPELPNFSIDYFLFQISKR